MKTKQELEQAIEMLDAMVVSNTSEMISVQSDLKDAKKELENLNKPELTTYQIELLEDAVERGVGEFDFRDQDNFDKEFELDYDGRVQLSNLDLTESGELVEEIMKQVVKLFSEIENEDEDND